jgi:hypothetical protein
MFAGSPIALPRGPLHLRVRPGANYVPGTDPLFEGFNWHDFSAVALGPQDIGIANVDLRPTMTGMTGIDPNSIQVGVAAAALLISLMREHARGPVTVPRVVMVEGTFVPGQTGCRTVVIQ